MPLTKLQKKKIIGESAARTGGKRPSDKKAKLAKRELGVQKNIQKERLIKANKHTKIQANKNAQAKAIGVLMRQLKTKQSILSRGAKDSRRKARDSRRKEVKGRPKVARLQERVNTKSAPSAAYNKVVKNRRAAQVKKAQNSLVAGVSYIGSATKGIAGSAMKGVSRAGNMILSPFTNNYSNMKF